MCSVRRCGLLGDAGTDVQTIFVSATIPVNFYVVVGRVNYLLKLVDHHPGMSSVEDGYEGMGLYN